MDKKFYGIWKWGFSQSFQLNDKCMMLILIGDTLMSQIGFSELDDHNKIIQQQGKLPSIVSKYMTKDLDYSSWYSKLFKM